MRLYVTLFFVYSSNLFYRHVVLSGVRLPLGASHGRSRAQLVGTLVHSTASFPECLLRYMDGARCVYTAKDLTTSKANFLRATFNALSSLVHESTWGNINDAYGTCASLAHNFSVTAAILYGELSGTSTLLNVT